MSDLKKGHYGYLKRRRIQLGVRSLILLAGIIILVVIGIVATGSRRNLMTVAAVVTALPLANQVVVLIPILGVKGRPKEEYDQVKALTGSGLLNTELVVTAREGRSMLLDYAYIHEKGVFIYSTDKKMDAKKTAAYLEGFIENNSLKSTVFVLQDYKKFLRRLSELEPEDRSTVSEDLLRIEGTIRALAV